MAFASNSGGGPMADINVTPLVDVMLVLLIIFMVTMPIQSVPVDVDLPQKTLNPPPQQKDPPDPISLRIDAAGQVFWNDTPTPVNALQTMMKTEVDRDRITGTGDRDQRRRRLWCRCKVWRRQNARWSVGFVQN
jgi:biopolymer transport protein ExbD